MQTISNLRAVAAAPVLVELLPDAAAIGSCRSHSACNERQGDKCSNEHLHCRSPLMSDPISALAAGHRWSSSGMEATKRCAAGHITLGVIATRCGE